MTLMIVQRYSINKHQFLFFQKNKVGLKPFKPYSAHLVTSLHTVCISRKGRTGGGGWSSPQGDIHMVAARLGCERAMVGTRWATSRSDCMDRLRKHCSPCGSWKAACVLSWCMTWLRIVTSLLIRPENGLGQCMG